MPGRVSAASSPIDGCDGLCLNFPVHLSMKYFVKNIWPSLLCVLLPFSAWAAGSAPDVEALIRRSEYLLESARKSPRGRRSTSHMSTATCHGKNR
jgi:hypothetical protein